MYFKFVIIALAAFLSFSNLDSKETVRLLYPQKNPVQITVNSSIEFRQYLLEQEISFKGQQNLVSSLQIQSRDKEADKNNFVTSLTWTLKDLRFNVDFNGRQFSFNPTENDRSIFASEIGKWINKPIDLKMDSSLALQRNSDQLDALMKKYPTIDEVSPYTMLEGLLQPIFALENKDLSVGDVIERNNVKGNFGLPLSSIKYEITDITPKEVVAKYTGSIQSQEISFDRPAGEMTSKISVSGSVVGNARWNRNNALIGENSGEYECRCILKMGGVELPLVVKVKSDFKAT